MDILNDPGNQIKERHGCVTAWLIFMLVANSLVVIMYLIARRFLDPNLTGRFPSWAFILLGFMGLANVMFATALLQWKRWGFFGFAITTLAAFFINLQIRISLIQAIFGLIGVLVLDASLQIKRDGVSAWSNLE